MGLYEIINLICRFYTIEALREAWSIPVNPVPHRSEWERLVPANVRDIVIRPPLVDVKVGRRQKKRILSQGEDKQPRKCGRCKQHGHYRQTCTGDEYVPVTSYDKAP